MQHRESPSICRVTVRCSWRRASRHQASSTRVSASRVTFCRGSPTPGSGSTRPVTWFRASPSIRTTFRRASVRCECGCEGSRIGCPPPVVRGADPSWWRPGAISGCQGLQALDAEGCDWRAFNRCGAERLHSRCSGPRTDSPSAWPRSHNWPGRISPPTPSSAKLHAAPRAHRTVPDATRPRHTARRRAWSRYSTLPTASRTRSPQTGEQNFSCHLLGTYSRPHNSQNRGPDATHFAAFAGRGRRDPTLQYRRFPCIARNSRPHHLHARYPSNSTAADLGREIVRAAVTLLSPT